MRVTADGGIVYTRVIHPASWVYITITYREPEGSLSITGKTRHSGGQIVEELSGEEVLSKPQTGYNREKILKIQELWRRWHLNDMRAGTPRQEEFVWSTREQHGYEYKEVCRLLEEANLLVDNGYQYGTAHLTEEVPQDVLEYLFTLPAYTDAVYDSYLDLKSVDEEEFLNLIGA